MLAFWVSPRMGIAVSNGALATKVLVAPKGAGLVAARKGASPVAVGPMLTISKDMQRGVCLYSGGFTGIYFWSGLEILGHMGGACLVGSLLPVKVGSSTEAGQGKQEDGTQRHDKAESDAA